MTEPIQPTEDQFRAIEAVRAKVLFIENTKGRRPTHLPVSVDLFLSLFPGGTNLSNDSWVDVDGVEVFPEKTPLSTLTSVAPSGMIVVWKIK